MNLREKIAISLVARDEEISLEEATVMWDSWKLSAQYGHGADCTHEPYACSKCQVDKVYEGADQFLALISKDIKKVENPYHEHNMPGYSNKYPEFAGFEDACQKILALFCSKEQEQLQVVVDRGPHSTTGTPVRPDNILPEDRRMIEREE